MDPSKRQFLISSSALALLLGGRRPASALASVSVLQVFGDSNVDSGNLFRLSQGRANAPPAWQGRASNGPVVVEYLAAMLGAQLQNYAVGGATTGFPNIEGEAGPLPGYPSGTGLQGQLDAFELGGRRLEGHEQVIVWAGSNDLYGARRQDHADLARRIDTACANIDRALRRLQHLGARHIVVANRTPRKALRSDDNLNGIDLNSAIAPTVQRAAYDLGIDIRLFDAYAAIADMMRNPAQHGFTDGSTLCNSIPACAWDSYEGGQPVASGYVLWDTAHKTTRVHQLMGEQMVSMLRLQ